MVKIYKKLYIFFEQILDLCQLLKLIKNGETNNMILGTFISIFCLVALINYFNGTTFLIFIGLTLDIIETIILIYTKQLKNLTTKWLAILIALGMTFGGANLFEAISLCICFENVICFVLGLILIIIVLFFKRNHKSIITNINLEQENENLYIINELSKKSGLSKTICTDVYNILNYFIANNSELAYEEINTLISHLKHENKIGNVGIAFGMLISNPGLSKDEANDFSAKVITSMIKQNKVQCDVCEEYFDESEIIRGMCPSCYTEIQERLKNKESK